MGDCQLVAFASPPLPAPHRSSHLTPR